MGRKTKTIPRTKNNAQPSSSSRCAELLGTNPSAFVGFQLPAGFKISDDISKDLDTISAKMDYSDLQLAFKKMTKKDATTKSKALQEFIEIIATADTEKLTTSLPLWSKIYNNLSIDVEPRVRELTQQAHGKLTSAAGKAIAPFMRQLASTWIVMRFDSFAPAASFAENSFKNAFPAPKHLKVFSFCHKELLTFLFESITASNASLIGSSLSAEERETKSNLIAKCSLQAYALYLKSIPRDELTNELEKNMEIIRNSKFWNLSKSKVPNIRSAWFECITEILQFAEFLINDYQQQVVTIVFSNLNESDSIVLNNLWSAALLVTRKNENWHQCVNVEKLLLSKLNKELKSGGNGNASIIFPHVLPLLEKLDENVLGDKLFSFNQQLFVNIKEGLTIATSTLITSEILAILTCYHECIQYVLMQLIKTNHFDNIQSMHVYCCQLIDEHIIGTLMWFLENQKTYSKNVFLKFAKLIMIWSQKNHEVYPIMMNHFWTELYLFFERSVKLDNNPAKVLLAQWCLLENFNSRIVLNSNRKSIKFTESNDDSVDASTGDEIQKNCTDINAYEKELQNFVYKLCYLYLNLTSDTLNPTYLNNLRNILTLYDNEQLFKRLSDADNVAELSNKLALWLLKSSLCSEEIVDIILLTYPYLEQNEQTEILKKLIKFPKECVNNWTLTKLLSSPNYASDSNVLQLISDETVSNMLINCAKTAIIDGNEEKLNFLSKYFVKMDSGKILLKLNTCEQILKIVAKPFENTNRPNVLDMSAKFLARVMPVVCGDDVELNRLQRFLFLSFIELSLNENVEILEETLEIITNAWQNSLEENALELDGHLLHECCNIFKNKLLASGKSAPKIIENISSIASSLICCSLTNGTSESLNDDFCFILNEIKDIELNGFEELCLHLELINGTLMEELIDIPDKISINVMDTIQLALRTGLFKGNYLCQILCNDLIDSDSMLNIDELWSDTVLEHLVKVMYIETLGKRLVHHMSNVPVTFKECLYNLSERIVSLLLKAPIKAVEYIKNNIITKAQSNGLFWASCALHLANIKPYNDEETGLVLLFEDLIASNSTADMPNNTIIQVISKKIGKRQLPILPGIFKNSDELFTQVVTLQCLIDNYFESNYNEMDDTQIIERCLGILTQLQGIVETDKSYLLYNHDLDDISSANVIFVSEIINFFAKIIQHFPSKLTHDHWDLIKIALSSWVLTIGKSSEQFVSTKVSTFIASVYRLFDALYEFLIVEKTKSSTMILTTLVEEWEEVFAKHVNVILIKYYIKFVVKKDETDQSKSFIDLISRLSTHIDFNNQSEETLKDVLEFSIENMSHYSHHVRSACMTFIRQLIPNMIKEDVKLVQNRNDMEQRTNEECSSTPKHSLCKFDAKLSELHEFIRKANVRNKIVDPSQIYNLSPSVSMPYLLLWNCILEMCLKTPPEVRSVYASFITENAYDSILLMTLFNLMPNEVYKNPDSKQLGQTYFVPFSWEQIKNPELSIERYACFIYLQTLRALPVIARKWWIDLNPRQKTFVDKITTNCVSYQLCQDELRSLIDNREKHENMQITVHLSSREVLATYSIDEARLELVIALPINHPLGAIKVEGCKQIGGRLQSRVLVMQLAMFLTHQNGSIQNVLTLWKRNLDRKFEGVEDCYVCYSVIHQHTCQLPKLSCKTCKKKFHGPCLYKWFNTSNKSTCPICRNIF